jgi:hypothetical protein
LSFFWPKVVLTEMCFFPPYPPPALFPIILSRPPPCWPGSCLRGAQRPFFKNMVCPRGELVPQGWTLSPRGKFTPSFTSRGEHSIV